LNFVSIQGERYSAVILFAVLDHALYTVLCFCNLLISYSTLGSRDTRFNQCFSIAFSSIMSTEA